jgi:2-keto-4-pentenoate hydratase/2-oxohepta-3-ene-1,7-dioic acid hydratase in catechol pathway
MTGTPESIGLLVNGDVIIAGIEGLGEIRVAVA